MSSDGACRFKAPAIGSITIAKNVVAISNPHSSVGHVDGIMTIVSSGVAIGRSASFRTSLRTESRGDEIVRAISFVNSRGDGIGMAMPVVVCEGISLRPRLLGIPTNCTRGDDLIAISPTRIRL